MDNIWKQRLKNKMDTVMKNLRKMKKNEKDRIAIPVHKVDAKCSELAYIARRSRFSWK